MQARCYQYINDKLIFPTKERVQSHRARTSRTLYSCIDYDGSAQQKNGWIGHMDSIEDKKGAD